MIISILGRQDKLAIAELESFFGGDKIKQTTDKFAIVDANSANIDMLGGTKKLAKLDLKFTAHNPKIAHDKIFRFYRNRISKDLGKINLGVSWYNDKVSPRQVQKIGLELKKHLKKHDVGVRLIPNQKSTLSTATVFHNKLSKFDKKIEIIICQTGNHYFIGRTFGVQDINQYTKRDRSRPKRDARVGMLPPKLAQIFINLSRPKPYQESDNFKLLDPFCGTGVVLQEAHLLGFEVYGTDLEERMIDYTEQNLAWLDKNIQPTLEVGDATTHQWQIPIDCIASETYLGYPFKKIQPEKYLKPEKDKIEQLVKDFLTNLLPQIHDQTRICIAVPAWLRENSKYLDLDTIKTINLAKLGYKKVYFKNINFDDLIYYRDQQIVARRILVLEKKKNTL